VCLALLAPQAAAGCKSNGTETAESDGSAVVGDASQEDVPSEYLDAGLEPDAEETDAPPEPSPGPEVEEGAPCENSAQCDDHVYCNGAELCAPSKDGTDPVCQPALRLPCSAEHPCLEALQDCECSDRNIDGDAYDARECGGDDCDDSRDDCYPGATEVCDPEGRDEDCKPTTYNNQFQERHLDGDADGDGRIDERCHNRDPDTGELHGGIDCDDHNPSIHREASEVCDYHDNNCNGFVDEKLNEDGTSEPEHGGLMVTFFPDFDQDNYGSSDGESERACDFFQRPGYILATEGLDCNDMDRAFNPDVPEVCDGKDNDCDGKVDNEDPSFRQTHFFDSTEVDCQDGGELIVDCPDDKLWCPELGDPIEQGCRRDATLLSSCRACRTDCHFACGGAGCDEIKQLAAGESHTCAATREGRVACWGRGGLGALGNDGTTSSSVPVLVVGVSEATDVAAGADHSCAIVGPEQLLVCWGSNHSRQLGSLDVQAGEISSVATRVAGIDVENTLTGVVQVAAGDAHTCAVVANGNVACFGATDSGRLGNGASGSGSSQPVLARRRVFNPALQLELPVPINDARLIAVGNAHSCVVTTTGFVECWGDNSLGQLADNSAQASGFAKRVAGLSNVTQIAAGGGHTCALSSGQVFCWGFNRSLQLGRARDAEEYVPKPVANLTGVLHISASQTSTCALTAARSVVCWGRTYLGLPEESQFSAEPIPAPIGDDVSLITTGGTHSCALSVSQVRCWGDNQLGQLGIGNASFDPERIPAPVRALAGSVR
jgi:alpha-tubulin suppressor-like RCC1 family protein